MKRKPYLPSREVAIKKLLDSRADQGLPTKPAPAEIATVAVLLRVAKAS